MHFSEAHNIIRKPEDDWFDPILEQDTKLFIDPFLVFESDNQYFVGAYEQIIEFFQDAYDLRASIGGNFETPQGAVLLSMLEFHEVPELCLGYASTSTRGSGTSRGFARLFADAIGLAIAAGIANPVHFEQVGLLQVGIGCDRISDATANLLKERLVTYTQEVCKSHDVHMEEFRLGRGRYSHEARRWMRTKVLLPRNRVSGSAVLLVPAEFLDVLPEISSDSFEDYVMRNEDLRAQLNVQIGRSVRKADIVAAARKHPDWVAEFIQHIERAGGRPYDLERDQYGLYQWAAGTSRFVKENPVRVDARDRLSFLQAVETMLGRYKSFVEAKSGYRLLWDGSRPKPEEAAQLVLLGLVLADCRNSDIDISRETNIGRGPVDFKFSSRNSTIRFVRSSSTVQPSGLVFGSQRCLRSIGQGVDDGTD